MKKRYLFLFIIMALFMIFPAVSAEIIESGSCGDNVFYTVDSDGTLTISGTGTMNNYTKGTSPFYRKSNIKNVIIENGVENIGEYIFYGSYSLKSITIPKSITSIGQEAFNSCWNLENFYINGLEEYLNINFNGDSSSPMYYARALYIDGEQAVSLIIPQNVSKIPDNAFNGCCSLESITINDNVTQIGKGSFFGCTYLTDINIPQGIKSIGEKAFYGCEKIKTVNIPKNTEDIGKGAFAYCSSLSNISVSEDNLYYSSLDGNLYNKNKTELIQYAIGKDDNKFDIPGSVENIGYCAFAACKDIKNITIPDSVENIDSYAFSLCTYLTDIIIPKSVKNIGDWAFSSCEKAENITLSEGVEKIGKSAFSGCSSLKKIIIPKSIKNIEESLFSGCNSLEIAAISCNVINIGNNAFEYCSSLENIYIPKSVKSIGESVFWECSGLKYIYYSGNETDWGSVNISDYGNDDLKNTEIIYNSAIPCQFTKITVNKIEKDNMWQFEINAEDKFLNSIVYAVIYDKNSKIIKIISVPLETEGNTTVTDNKTPEGKFVKIFVWTDKMQPVSETADIDL